MLQTILETAVENPVISETKAENAANSEPRVIKWMKEAYRSMAELGFFEGKRTESLEGENIEMPTMKSPHATALKVNCDVLRAAFKSGFAIRNQLPIDFGKDFETMPNIAVIKGNARDLSRRAPADGRFGSLDFRHDFELRP